MGIRSVITNLCTIERGLAITDPYDIVIKHAYPYPPPIKVALPDRPCWTNSWTMTNFAHEGGSESDQSYAVHAQLFIAEASPEADVSAEIATAFHEGWLAALIADPQLGGACNLATPRGGDPTLAILERGALVFVGLDEYVDVIVYA
jgi:hypothetical protein